MALITKLGLDDVYKAIKAQFREIRRNAAEIRAEAAAGPVSFSRIREYFENLSSQITYCDTMIAKYPSAVLQAYARAQEDSATYNPATDYAAMKTAATAVANHIATALPTNSAHTVTNGRVVEPSFTSVQTAALRGLLDTLIGTLDTP